ncbi:MFS transporter [Marmoricola endophyticus]|uniref:MFS transporter n=1 Tax=Marmoricola endophyticus TaxID=2040280 RepID=A0A917BES7_9ACTN|nr:MFS transporter [Marmoricola endophyticus]
MLATMVIGLGLFFDAYENFLAGTIGKVLQIDLDLSQTELSALLGSAFVGQFLGAVVMGRFADRFGRRRAFMINLAVYSVFSLIGAFSPNAIFLVVTRFVAGVGIGAEYALADTYLSDLMPSDERGRFISWAYTVSFLGVPVVGLMARFLVPLEPWGVDGWRYLFVFGALGSFLVWLVRRNLPESPRWLELEGRHEEAEELVSAMEQEAVAAGHTLREPDLSLQPGRREPLRVSTLFRAPYTRRTIMLWLLSALEVFGYYGFGTLAPLVLVAKGYDVVNSLGYIAATYAGYPLGALLAVPIVERIERKYLVMVTAALMAVFGLAFGLAGTGLLVIVFGLAYTVSSNVFSNAYHVYLAESYPTKVRATAAGAAYSLSKLVTGGLPFLLLPVLDASGATPVFSVVAVAMALLVLNVGVLGQRTMGRSADAT